MAEQIAATLCMGQPSAYLCGRRNERVPGGEPKTVKDLPDHVGRVDGAQYPHARAAAGTDQNVKGKYTDHQLSPGIISRSGAALGFGRSLLAGLRLRCGVAARMHRRVRFYVRNNQAPEGCRRGQHAEVSGEIESRGRNQRCEPFYQFHGLIDHMGGAVAPAVFEAIEKLAVRQQGKVSIRRWILTRRSKAKS